MLKRKSTRVWVLGYIRVCVHMGMFAYLLYLVFKFPSAEQRWWETFRGQLFCLVIFPLLMGLFIMKTQRTELFIYKPHLLKLRNLMMWNTSIDVPGVRNRNLVLPRIGKLQSFFDYSYLDIQDDINTIQTRKQWKLCIMVKDYMGTEFLEIYSST